MLSLAVNRSPLLTLLLHTFARPCCAARLPCGTLSELIKRLAFMQSDVLIEITAIQQANNGFLLFRKGIPIHVQVGAEVGDAALDKLVHTNPNATVDIFVLDRSVAQVVFACVEGVSVEPMSWEPDQFQHNFATLGELRFTGLIAVDVCSRLRLWHLSHGVIITEHTLPLPQGLVFPIHLAWHERRLPRLNQPSLTAAPLTNHPEDQAFWLAFMRLLYSQVGTESRRVFHCIRRQHHHETGPQLRASLCHHLERFGGRRMSQELRRVECSAELQERENRGISSVQG